MKTLDYKVSTSDVSEFSVKLRSTHKIINAVKKINADVFLVPFKAEFSLSNEELVERGYRRLVDAEADLIVVNDVGRNGAGFGVETNEVFIVDRDKNVVHIPLMLKSDIARQVFDLISERIKLKEV